MTPTKPWNNIQGFFVVSVQPIQLQRLDTRAFVVQKEKNVSRNKKTHFRKKKLSFTIYGGQ